MLTGSVPVHPARFSPPVLTVIEPLLRRYSLPVHDPFAGTGQRLGKLCDELGLEFTGTDIEPWIDQDRRVRLGNSTNESTYPAHDFIVVTSPVYFANRISTDYLEGQTAATKVAGRHAYGISRGAALHPDNMARVCRPNNGDQHDAMAAACLQWWPERVLLNVDAPIVDRWVRLAWQAGYLSYRRIEAKTERLRGGLTGVSKRAPHEVVLIMRRRRT